MKEKNHLTKTGFWFTVQNLGAVSHLIIRDSNLYPDEDSRSQRPSELLIPINDERDLKKIMKLFKKVL